jgi:DNA-binding transcriptional regulator YiaG
MTPIQFKQARLRLGLSQSEMAEALGVEGAHGGRTVRRWESGERTVPGSVAKLLALLLKAK